MAIRIVFPDPADSPTGAAEVRLRYGMHRRDGRTVPVLTYRAATAIELTRSAWEGYRVAGAAIECDNDREQQIVREAPARASYSRATHAVSRAAPWG